MHIADVFIDLVNFQIITLKNHTMGKNKQKKSNGWKIDSLRFEIPKQYVDINPKLTRQYYLLDKETGEIEDLMPFQKSQMLQHEVNGVIFQTRLYKRPIRGENNKFTGEVQEWLQVLLSAKMLGKDYYKGITQGTVKQLYDNFMSYDHFKCTYENFLDAFVFDIDFCKDIDRPRKEVNKFIQALDLSLKPNTSRVYKNRSGDVSTLQFSHREKSTFKYPYYKIYNKYDEFTSRTRYEKLKNFYDAHKIPYPKKTHFRKEITVKSKRAFTHLGSLYTNRFGSVLGFVNDDEQFIKLLIQLENYHIKQYVDPEDFKSIPAMLGYIVHLSHEHGLDYKQTKDECISHLKLNGASERTVRRFKNEITQQIELHNLRIKPLITKLDDGDYEELYGEFFSL